MRRLYSSDRFREEERTDHAEEMGAALQNNKGSCCMAALRLQQVFRLSGVDCSFESIRVKFCLVSVVACVSLPPTTTTQLSFCSAGSVIWEESVVDSGANPTS